VFRFGRQSNVIRSFRARRPPDAAGRTDGGPQKLLPCCGVWRGVEVRQPRGWCRKRFREHGAAQPGRQRGRNTPPKDGQRPNWEYDESICCLHGEHRPFPTAEAVFRRLGPTAVSTRPCRSARRARTRTTWARPAGRSRQQAARKRGYDLGESARARSRRTTSRVRPESSRWTENLSLMQQQRRASAKQQAGIC